MTFTVTEQLLAIDHIVDRIISYTDRRSLSRMMSVSKAMYHLVARPLYRNAAVWEETMNSFMLGATQQCECEKCIARFKEDYGYDVKTGKFTPWGAATNQPHRYGKYTSNRPTDAELKAQPRNEAMQKARQQARSMCAHKEEIATPKTVEELAAERDEWIPDFHKTGRQATGKKTQGRKNKGNKIKRTPRKGGKAAKNTTPPSSSSTIAEANAGVKPASNDDKGSIATLQYRYAYPQDGASELHHSAYSW